MLNSDAFLQEGLLRLRRKNGHYRVSGITHFDYQKTQNRKISEGISHCSRRNSPPHCKISFFLLFLSIFKNNNDIIWTITVTEQLNFTFAAFLFNYYTSCSFKFYAINLKKNFKCNFFLNCVACLFFLFF